jgi:hypothetical protein
MRLLHVGLFLLPLFNCAPYATAGLCLTADEA